MGMFYIKFSPMEIIKIVLIFGIILFLIVLKWDLGMIMVIGSGLIWALYGVGFIQGIYIIKGAVFNYSTIELVIILALIMILENIWKKRNILKRLMNLFNKLIKDRRIIMAFMPAMVGLLPSAGGAIFSAPMVDEATSNIEVSPEKKSFINYWFRHLWEYILPLYPGILLASFITKIDLKRLIMLQIPYTLATILAGLFVGLRGIKIENQDSSRSVNKIYRDTSAIISGILPIFLILIAVLVLHIDFALFMGIIIISLFIFHRFSFDEILESIKEGISIRTLFLIVGVVIFKGMLEGSGSINMISQYITTRRFPEALVFFSLPFIAGILTGMTIGFVGPTYPLLIAIEGGKINEYLFAFAFASGYAGVILSPLHLCLILTKDYFQADFIKIFKMLFIPELFVFIVAIISLLIHQHNINSLLP
jgi:hypothetical protein